MRAVRVVTAATLLAGTAVVVPVVSVGAAHHSVAPSVDRVRMPAGHAAPGAGRLTAGGTADEGGPVESTLTRDTDGADVVGVTFPDLDTARTVAVTVRTR